MLNIPNILTISRIAVVPLFVYFLFRETPVSSILAYALFLAASITDFLDGYIARKFNITTPFGAFWDPLSDKIITGAAFISFSILNYIYFPWWIVAVILFREVTVTLFRIAARRKNSEMKTEFAGKLKTAFQMFTINIILIYIIIYRYLSESGIALSSKGVANSSAVWVSIVGQRWAYVIYFIPFCLGVGSALLSIISMLIYTVKNIYIFKKEL